MSAWTRWLLLASLLFGLVHPVLAQNRKDLEKKRNDLDKQIRTTTALIDQARKDQTLTQQQLQLLNQQINAREELIRTINSEVFRTDQQIREDQEAIRSMEEDLEELKEEYARMLRFAYRNRSGYDRLSYVFASESFAQAFKRSRYLNQVAEQRRRQALLIGETRDALVTKVDELKALKEEKARLMDGQLKEKERLARDRIGQQQALSTLRKEEGRLKETQRRQQKQRSDLDAAIRKAIEAELKPKAGAKPGRVTLDLTPEARELNSDFEKNKGKLPWPVEKGVITAWFGKHNHPVLPGIIVENSGIDITTEKGSTVRAVFRGEVSSVIVLPGAGKAVIVSHGAYRSVYSNLREVSVTKGQKVETKQAIGSVLTDDDGSKAHFELWKITPDGQVVKVDPAPWLYR